MPERDDDNEQHVILDRVDDPAITNPIHTTTRPTLTNARLPDAEVHVEPGNPEIEVTVTVPVPASTLTALTERALREGRNVEAVIADVLHAAA